MSGPMMLMVVLQGLNGILQKPVPACAECMTYSVGLHRPHNAHRSDWKQLRFTRSCFSSFLWAILRPVEANRVDCRTGATWNRLPGPCIKALQHYQEYCVAAICRGEWELWRWNFMEPELLWWQAEYHPQNRSSYLYGHSDTNGKRSICEVTYLEVKIKHLDKGRRKKTVKGTRPLSMKWRKQ